MPFDQLKRREFISLLGVAAAAWPVAARAQQAAMPVIGWLSPGSREADQFRLAMFERGLAETAHVVGKNVALEYRWAEDRHDRLPTLAAELIQRRVSVIAAAGNVASRVAKAATSAVPIVFLTGIDPVAMGLVASIARPGGNVTGITDLTAEMGPKHLEILHELAPAARRIALLVNPDNPNSDPLARVFPAVARILGLEIHVLHASGERDLDAVFARMRELRIEGLVIGVDPLFNSQSEHLAKLATDHSLPSIHVLRQFVAAGGLASYGGGPLDAYRQVGAYCGRVLKGEKPADLPVQQVTKFNLVINRKTADELGLTIPPQLYIFADEVIE
jgi:putative tryptophan/tyrosine transport system substrate-binding protein